MLSCSWQNVSKSEILRWGSWSAGWSGSIGPHKHYKPLACLLFWDFCFTRGSFLFWSREIKFRLFGRHDFEYEKMLSCSWQNASKSEILRWGSWSAGSLVWKHWPTQTLQTLFFACIMLDVFFTQCSFLFWSRGICIVLSFDFRFVHTCSRNTRFPKSDFFIDFRSTIFLYTCSRNMRFLLIDRCFLHTCPRNTRFS